MKKEKFTDIHPPLSSPYIEMIEKRDYTEPYDATEDVEKLQKYAESWIEGYKKWKTKKERCPHN